MMLAALVCVSSPGAATARSSALGAPQPGQPVRVLVVGDSMTQGSQGDWTWRFRLWQHFQEAGLDVHFVGPRTDIWEESQNYVDPHFDRDHASKWGLSLALLSADYPIGIGQTIADLVEDYHPDVVLELLGVNDLTFLNESPKNSATGCVTSCPRHGGRIRGSTWCWAGSRNLGRPRCHRSTPCSKTSLTSFTHRPPRPLPDVPLGPRIQPVLDGTPGVATLDLSWQESPGATDYAVLIRDLTEGSGWQRVAEDLTGTS